MKRALTAAEKQQFQGTVQWLMAEDNLTEASAWDIVATPSKALKFGEGHFGPEAARRRAFKEVKLSEAQQHARTFGDGRARPGTTIQETRPTRGVAPVTVEASRKPGESLTSYQARLRDQILALGKPANIATAKPKGQPSLTAKPYPAGSSADSDSFAELKRKQLASEPLQARERIVHSAPEQPDTTAQRDAALARMRGRGESVDIRSAGFSERYKAALKEGR